MKIHMNECVTKAMQTNPNRYDVERQSSIRTMYEKKRDEHYQHDEIIQCILDNFFAVGGSRVPPSAQRNQGWF